MNTKAVLEDLALALDAKAEVARLYNREAEANAYENAAAMLRRRISS